jgi:MFS family permease
MSAPMHATADDARCRRFLRRYYLAHFWYDFIFAYAVYTLYFSLRGMSVLDISLLITWWSITSMAMEVPSGALADAWSRQKLLVLSPLIKSLCFITWFLAGGRFWLFALGFLLWSIGGSLRSGTSEALLYDTLAHHGKRDDYEQVLGKREFYFHIGLAISTVSGGLIAAYRVDWAILLSVIPLLFSAAAALGLEDAPKVKSTGEVRYFEHLRLALREMRSNRILLFLVIGLWLLPFSTLEEYDQLYYQLVKLPVAAFGVVAFTGSMLSALAARWAYRMKHADTALYALPLAGAALLVLVWRLPSIPMLSLLLLSYSLAVPVRVLLESRIQHAIVGVSRATVTSAVALLLELPQLSLAFGFIGRAWGLTALYLASAIMVFTFAGWTLTMRRFLRMPRAVLDEEPLSVAPSLPMREDP